MAANGLQRCELAFPASVTHADAEQCLSHWAAALPVGAVQASLQAGPLQTFDSSAVAVMLALRRQLLAGGGALHVTGMPPKLAELVTLYGVTDLLGT